MEGLLCPVRYIRLDSAGENLAVAATCKQKGVIVEYTAPYTPQFNGVVERMFATIKGKGTACLVESGIKEKARKKTWAHAFDDICVVQNILPRKGYVDAYEPFHEKAPVRAEHLVPWGVLGEMTKPTKQPNFQDKSERVRRVGYDRDHPSDTYLVRKESN